MRKSTSFHTSSHGSPLLPAARPFTGSLFGVGGPHRVTPTSHLHGLLGGDAQTQSLETQSQFVTWDDPTSRAQMAKLAPDLAKKCSESSDSGENDDDDVDVAAQNDAENDVTRSANASKATSQVAAETASFDSLAELDLNVILTLFI